MVDVHVRRVLLALLAVAGCGDSSNLGDGQECVSSSECAAGLLCDYGPTPHVCRPTGSIGPGDLSAVAGADLAGADLSGVDLAGADLSGSDLTPAVVDLSGPDLTPEVVDLSGPD